MNDAAIWFALILVAVTGWGYAFALAMTLRSVRNDLEWAGTSYQAQGRSLNEALQQRDEARRKLAQASKNDARDAKGRYVSAEAICTEPQGYVGKAHSDALRRQASL